MYFDYLLYVDVCLKEASLGFAIVIIFILFALIHFYIFIIKKKDYCSYNLIFYLFVSIICGTGLLQCGGKLIHGINLIEEKEDDAVEIYGKISNMKSINDFTRRLVGDKYGYDEISGTIFTIDGIKCTAPLNCSLEVGDYVTVRYLPKSGYIMYISKADDS